MSRLKKRNNYSKVKGVTKYNVEEMYSELLEHYSTISLRSRQLVERLISEKMAQGLSREEAIFELYKEIVTKRKALFPEEEGRTELERSLIRLKRELDRTSNRFLAAIITCTFLTIALSFFFPGFLLILIILVIGLAIVSTSRSIAWSFDEDIVIEKGGSYINEVIELVPLVFQELTLQEITHERKDNKLTIRLHLEKSVLEHSGRSTVSKLVELGDFIIEAEFKKLGKDLVVNVKYRSQVKLSHANIAAEAYERVVVAFRSAIRESFERVRLRKAITLDFVKLAKLMASTGVIVKAIKCPNCGANIDLPKKGDTVKCPYCNATIKAIDVYEMIKELLKEL